jgi:hypothetical protein
VIARRVRRQVLEYCSAALAAGSLSTEGKYWIVATQWEAAVGLGDAVLATHFRSAVEASNVAAWMLDSTKRQIAQLEALVAASPLSSTS